MKKNDDLQELLSSIEWGTYKIGDLFSLSRGKRLTEYDRKNGTIPYYSASKENNGLTDFISNPLFIDSNKIIISTFGDAYFVVGEFTASDEVTILDHEKLNEYNSLFIVQMIKQNKDKFRFGWKAFSNRIARQTINLPLTKDGSVDWLFMENFMKIVKKEIKPLIVSEVYDITDIRELDNINWKEFAIEEIATIISGKDIYQQERMPGNIPYITSTALNNGIGYSVSNLNNTLEKNCISVNRNGSVGYAFFHGYNALYSNDVRKLKINKNNKYVSLFVTTSIKKQKEKYGYGLKLGTGRLKRQKIMLPVNNYNEPDWSFMEQYMKRLEDNILKRQTNKKI